MAQEFKTLFDLGGLASNSPIDKIPDRNASDCANIDFSINGLIQTRRGYRQFANKIEDAGQCLDYFLFRKNFGTKKDIHLRVRSDDTESILEYLDDTVSETYPDGVYRTLVDGLEPMASMGFAIANGDGGLKINKVVMGNAVDNMMQWNGALATIDEVTSNTIVCKETLATEGFDTGFNMKLIIDGVKYTYTGITDKTFTGVTPDPSAIPANTSVAQAVDDELLVETIIQADTISFETATEPKIYDSANGFIDAGFKAGMNIVIGGSTDNDGLYTITAVEAGMLTLSDTNFLTTEEAGNNVSISAGIPKGNILLTAQRKLWVSGGENESKVYYSQSGNITCFGITTGLGSGGSFDLLEGSGKITCIESKGKNTILIHKKDAIIAYSREAIDALSVRESFDTLGIGNGVGASFKKALVNYNQASYYMTSNEGVKNLSRAVNEDVLNISSITDQVLPTIREYDNSSASAVYYAPKKCIYIATNNSNGDRVVISIYIKQEGLYDISIDELPVADWLVDGDNLYFVSSLDQNTYLMFDRESDDNVFVNHHWVSKDFTFQEPSRGKTFNKLYVEGFVKEGTKINIEVFYGIGGNRGLKNHVVRWNDQSVVSFATLGALGTEVIGVNSFGNNTADVSDSRYFSYPIHLDVNKATRYRIRISTLYETDDDFDADPYWAISNIATNPNLEDVMYNEIQNSNEESNIVASTEAIVTEAEEFLMTEEGDFIVKK